MSTTSASGITVQFREDEAHIRAYDLARGSLPRNLWVREAGYKYALLIQAKAAPPIGDHNTRKRAPRGFDESKDAMVRFRISADLQKVIEEVRGDLSLNLWWRQAAEAYLDLTS